MIIILNDSFPSQQYSWSKPIVQRLKLWMIHGRIEPYEIQLVGKHGSYTVKLPRGWFGKVKERAGLRSVYRFGNEIMPLSSNFSEEIGNEKYINVGGTLVAVKE
jgi:hypothetical protein